MIDRNASQKRAALTRGLRGMAVLFFTVAGFNHFINPEFYHRIVPPGFPAPGLLVILSGVGEIAGGVGLLVRPLRRVAGWGLIALLIAVFPANIYMAVTPEQSASAHIPRWVLWLRLPLQGLFITWVWLVALRADGMRSHQHMGSAQRN